MKIRKTNNLVKRAVALLLVGAIAMVHFPENVFANAQNPINSTNFSIADNAVGTGGEGNYHVVLNWQWQATDASLQGPWDDAGAGVIHQPERFNIHSRNATTGGPFNAGTLSQAPVTIVDFNPISPAHNTTIILPDTPLTIGSIFSFIVVPEHTHLHTFTDMNGDTVTTLTPIQPTIAQVLELDNLTGRSSQRLYLTDIVITEVDNNEPGITLQWHNPTFDGQQVFSGYRISFRDNPAAAWTEVVNITPATPGVNTSVTQGGRNFWQYTLPSGILTTGNNYDFRVEPLHGATPFVSGNWILIGDVEYQLAMGVNREFIVEGVHVPPALSLVPLGSDYISLNWDVPPTVNIQHGRVELWASTEEEFDFAITSPATMVSAFVNTAGSSIADFHIMDRPTVPTWFIVRYVFPQGPIGSQVPGTPGTSNPPPTPHMVSNIVFFDPLFNDFTAYLPAIRSVNVDIEQTPLNIQLEWDAFIRRAFTETELLDPSINTSGYIIDREIEYEFFVSDNLEHLRALVDSAIASHPDSVEANMIIPQSGVQNLIASPSTSAIAPGTVLADHAGVNRFNNATHPLTTFFPYPSGGATQLIPNNVYYVGILARRIVNGQRSNLVSEVGEIGVFVPPIDPIAMPPQMVPVRLQNIDGEPNITHNSIGIEWNIQWFEAYNRHTNRWYDTIGIDDEGTLVFGRGVSNPIDLWDNTIALQQPEAARAAVIAALGGSVPGGDVELILRPMHVGSENSGVTYQIHVVPFEEMGDNLEEYIDMISANDGFWTNIGPGIPSPGSGLPENFRHHEVTGLQPNTTYTVFFRPINQHGPASRPTYVTGTTIIVHPDLIPTPTVPFLTVVDVTDRSVRLRWNGSLEDFTYELYRSYLLAYYPEGSGRTAISPQDIAERGEQVGEYIYFTVYGLFPQTPYHFWIRAVNSAGMHSVWSNAVTATTLPIQPPPSPTTIIPISETHRQIYTHQTGEEIYNGPYNLALEFNRIHRDVHNLASGPVRGGYEADGYVTWINVYGMSNASYVVNFTELTANRRHYARVRTILTVFRQGEDIIWEYSYEMQLSENRNFLDPISIILPTPTHRENVTGQVIIAYGPWVEVYPFHTEMSDGEFDSNINPDLFPLPDQDFEFTFRQPGTLRKRIRGNQEGADGNLDNQVDQRFISRLVTNRLFSWEANLDNWYGPGEVIRRELELPFGVIEAFDERQIDLVINAGNMTLTIPHGSLVTPAVRNMPGLNRYTDVLISLDQTTAPTTNRETGLYTTPQNLTVTFTQGPNTVTVSEFVRPLDITMDMPSAHNPGHASISGYTNHANSGGWSRLSSDVSQLLATPTVPTVGLPRVGVSFSTRIAGSYSVISTPAAIGFLGQNVAAMHRVNTQLHITDMQVFDENLTIHANQFNQIVAAVALRQDSVTMNAPLDQLTTQSLGRSGMLVTGTTVSREEGISTLVRLLEVRTGNQVTLFPGPSESSFVDMPSVSPSNNENLRKAEALGFITTPTINPTGQMTFGDMFHILDIILSN